MPGAKDELRKEAFEMFRHGSKLKDIAEQLQVPAGTVRRWKCTDKWEQRAGANANAKANAKNDARANARNRRRNRPVTVEVQEEEKPGLTEKQGLFCLFYVRYFNATKAYMKAYGVDAKTAGANGYRLLKNDRIRQEIERLKQNRLNRELLSEADIFQKYMDIAFSDITDYLVFGQKEVPVMGPFGPIKVEDPDTGEKVPVTKIVNVVQFRESDEVDGTLISEVKQGRDGASIKLSDRMKALNWLADHMDFATPEQKAKVRKLEAETERIQRSGAPENEDDGVEIINDIPAEKETGADLGNNHSEVSEDIQQ
ncbi:terminase small subunit [Faecalibaculum rodentium]|uniref:terminase small subunit n=1 Tax=Faecalibaculum rodentium TaxID=1702221 RepID=UPI0025A29C71|nr:terminase small subunit [Faecalibaculum rodentium]